jgi:cytochrome c oxidase assembly factor CtaG
VWQVSAFGAGLVTLAIALLPPVDTLADVLFSVHMAQHLALIVVAAPLTALGAPQVPLLWALSRSMRVGIGRLVVQLYGLRKLGCMPVAFALHSLSIWLWHIPGPYEAALRIDALHALEHSSLLGSGFLFWAAAFHGLTRARGTLGASVLYVFALGAQCTGLGALIALSNRPWYAAYAWGGFGLSGMDDQILAGALMWVPASLLYLAYALVLLGAWLHPLNLAGADLPRRRPARRAGAQPRP